MKVLTMLTLNFMFHFLWFQVSLIEEILLYWHLTRTTRSKVVSWELHVVRWESNVRPSIVILVSIFHLVAIFSTRIWCYFWHILKITVADIFIKTLRELVCLLEKMRIEKLAIGMYSGIYQDYQEEESFTPRITRKILGSIQR